jgi:hypothetical protein
MSTVAVLNQDFGQVPRDADILKVFTGTTTADPTTFSLLFTVVNQGTTAVAFSTTACTVGTTTAGGGLYPISVSITSLQSALIDNSFTWGLVKTNAGGREPLAAGFGGAFDVPGL